MKRSDSSNSPQQHIKPNEPIQSQSHQKRKLNQSDLRKAFIRKPNVYETFANNHDLYQSKQSEIRQGQFKQHKIQNKKAKTINLTNMGRPSVQLELESFEHHQLAFEQRKRIKSNILNNVVNRKKTYQTEQILFSKKPYTKTQIYSARLTKLQQADQENSIESANLQKQLSKNSISNTSRKNNHHYTTINNNNKKNFCERCQLTVQSHVHMINDLKLYIQQLQNDLQQKDQKVQSLNKKVIELEQKSEQLKRKIKSIENHEYLRKISQLEKEIQNMQKQMEINSLKYEELRQMFKEKTKENNVLKKCEYDFIGLERKIELLTSERNQLRQKLSNVKFEAVSSYINYPSSFYNRNFSKNRNSSAVQDKGAYKNRKSQLIYSTTNNQTNQTELEDDDSLSSNFSFCCSNIERSKCSQQTQSSQMLSLCEFEND